MELILPESLSQACANVFLDPTVLGIILAAALYGVFIGSTPGLTATMATALLVPLTYWLGPVPALAAVVTMVACAIFAGDIPTTLVRIPGTPASAAYVDDVYAYTQRGQAFRALGVCLLGSVFGGLFGAVVLMALGHQLARMAVLFSSVEYFWLYLLGLSCAVLVSRGSLLHGLIGLLIGLLLSTVGLSEVHAQARFTFDNPELYQGINFIPAMIGLFGVSEVFKNMAQLKEVDAKTTHPPQKEATSLGRRLILDPAREVFRPALHLLSRRPLALFRSGGIGAVIGMLPGAGADIAAWVSIAVSRRSVKPTDSTKPTDSAPWDSNTDKPLEGVADATTANSSALAGAWIPALVFGIPGDSVTAIVLGVLLMKNIKPGPDIFVNQADLVYSIYLIFIVANLVLLPIGFLAIRIGALLVKIPRRVLLPIILLFCVLGAYAINTSYFDVIVMLVMGLLGFVLERRRVPLGPVVLGILLGGPLEARFINTLTGENASWQNFFNRPLAAGLGILSIAVWAVMIYRIVKKGTGTINRNGPEGAAH